MYTYVCICIYYLFFNFNFNFISFICLDAICNQKLSNLYIIYICISVCYSCRHSYSTHCVYIKWNFFNTLYFQTISNILLLNLLYLNLY